MVELKHAGRASGSTTSLVLSRATSFSSKVLGIPPSLELEISVVDIFEVGQAQQPLGLPNTGVGDRPGEYDDQGNNVCSARGSIRCGGIEPPHIPLR